MKTPLLYVALSTLAACSPAEPTSFTSRDRASNAANADCVPVKFNVQLVPRDDFSFTGQVTGDIEGTVTLVFEPSTVTFAGATIHNRGTATWTITGGVVPGLGTFQTAFDNLNINTDRPGSPATLFENSGTQRAISGVEQANLTYHGSFNLVPSPLASHDYHGVICP